MNIRLLAAIALALIPVIGCSTTKRTDLVSTGKVEVEKLDTPELILVGPEITQSEGIVEFKGEVHRKPSFDGTPGGHIHLDFYDAKGEWVDQIAVGWQPNDIPKTGERSSPFVIQYYWKPQPGAVVRASIVDDDHPADVASGRASGSSGSSSGKSIYGNSTPQPGGAPRTNATRTPGTPHQPSQSHTPGIPTGRGGSYGGHR